MFASQLLRILQTLPADANNKICVLDTAEEKHTMKGSENGILSHSNGYKEEDSLGLPTIDAGKDGNEFWKVTEFDDSFFDDISRNNNSEIRASSVSNDDKRSGNPFACDIPSSNTTGIDAASVADVQNGGLSDINHYKRAGNPFECDTKDRDQPWNIPELERSMIVDFLDDKENEAIDSDSPFNPRSELFETNTNSYTDKGVTNHDLPELSVCYRESNLNIVKDICMDEGEPAVDKVLIETWKDDQPGMSFSVGADEHQQSNRRGSVDTGSPTASMSKGSSAVDGEYIVTHDTEKEVTGALVQNGSKPSPEDNANKDADKDSYLEDLMVMFGSKCTTANGKAANVSEKTSFSNNVVHLGESNVEKSQKANSDGDQSALQPDQTPIDHAALKSQSAVSAANETNNNVPATSNSTKPEITKSTEKGAENSGENSVESKVISVHKDKNSDVHQQSTESQNVAKVEDHKPPGYLPPGGQGHFADGEASFSAAGPASGSITFSGPIAYSGSISLRSDSSTTSARSFAFPVLQNEWNSSPVRMAKAERRRLRKHKGWRQALLCCRF